MGYSTSYSPAAENYCRRRPWNCVAVGAAQVTILIELAISRTVSRIFYRQLSACFQVIAAVRRRTPYNRRMQDDASYVCDACGEEIVVPIDLSGGMAQDYVEDCPICCRPNVIHVEIDDDGAARVWSEAE